MNGLFDETLTPGRLDEPSLLHGSWMPLADVVETPGRLPRGDRARRPRKDDIVIQAHGDELVVRASAASTGGPTRVVPPPGEALRPFARTFRFAEEVDPDRIAAAFEEGS